MIALLRLTAGVEKGELAEAAAGGGEATLEQLSALTLHLPAMRRLALGKVCFCRKIENFGQYTPLGPGLSVPGRL